MVRSDRRLELAVQGPHRRGPGIGGADVRRDARRRRPPRGGTPGAARCRDDEPRDSRLVNDLPNDARAEVFQTLTDAFPEEAHFWAHRGRFLGGALKRYEEANQCLQRALTIDNTDNVLHHIRRMILRAQAYHLMDDPSFDGVTDAERASLASLVDEALAAFATARDLDRPDEHPYVSAVELLIVMFATLLPQARAV